MHEYALTHLSDTALLRELSHLVKQDRTTTARLIAHIAEVDMRRLYVPADHPSMFAYCVEELHFSEDSAYKRIRAARSARQFPAIYTALADGRLHLAAVTLLAPHLTSENVTELIDAATHRSKAEVERWIARRFAVVAAVAPQAVIRPIPQLAPGRVVSALGDLLAGTVSAAVGTFSAESDGSEAPDSSVAESAALPTSHAQSERLAQPEEARTELAPGRVDAALVLEERYSMHLTVSKSMHDKIRRAQCLLSHTIPSGDVVKVLERALDLLLSYEGRRLGSARPATPNPTNGERGTGRADTSRSKSSRNSRPAADPSRPRPGSNRRSSSSRTRYIPARVRRAVWERDQGQCTFVTLAGHRCSARRFLEFDHVEPVARGGRATVEGLRLRCRAHNQYAAEQTFGVEFMSQKRELARRERAAFQRQLARDAKDQPDKVREPSGSWCVTRPGATSSRTTRPGASSSTAARLGRVCYLAYAMPTVILRPGAG